MKLSEAERIAYSRYSDDLHYQASMVESSYGLDKLEGREEGREDKNIKLFRPRLLLRTHIMDKRGEGVPIIISTPTTAGTFLSGAIFRSQFSLLKGISRVILDESCQKTNSK